MEMKGRVVGGVIRRGKVLLLKFVEGDTLGFHFKMTGQLIYESYDKKNRIVGGHPTEDFVLAMPGKHTRAILKFEKGLLYFNDQRLFGWMEVNPKFVEKLGPEPFEMQKDQFVKSMQKVRRPIKVALMDQELISGVGNIYANDALWEAEIDPHRKACEIDETSLERIFEKTVFVLSEGIKYGGATYSHFKNASGIGGKYQEHFRTYQRDGKSCKRCGATINKDSLGGRGTYWCGSCQK